MLYIMDFGYATLIVAFVINLGCLAVVQFPKKPSDVVYSKSGADVYFEWDYEVDRSDLKALAFQWFTFVPAFDLGNQKQIYVETKTGTKKVGAQVPVSLQGRVDFQGKATLIIRNVSKADDNYYQFVIGSISEGDVPSTVRLFVTEPPKALGDGITPKSQKAMEGQSATFTCTVVGKPTPNITWMSVKQNDTLKDGEKYEVTGISGNSTLVITKANRSDNGEYQCVAFNPAGEVLKQSFFLTVPYIEIEKDLSVLDVYPTDEKEKELICAAFGWPEPAVTWTNKRTNKVSNGKSLHVMASNYGNYTCKAENIAGSKVLEGKVNKGAGIGNKSSLIEFTQVANATYYTVVGYLNDIQVYLGIGTQTKVPLNWCSLDKTLSGNEVTIAFIVLANNGDSNMQVAYGTKTIGRGNIVC